MAKTNSRVKKPATFTPASTGKSTFKPLTANTKLSNAGGFKPLTANTNTSTSVGQFVKGNKTFKYKAPNKTVAPTVKTTTAPASNTTSIYKGRGGVSKGGSQGTANKYANKKPLTTETKPRTRGGVSKGGSQGTASKYANKSNITTAALKERADARIAAEKATKERITKSPRVTAQQRLGDKKPTMSAAERRVVKTAEAQAKKAKAARAIKIAKVTKVAKVAGKGAAITGTLAAIGYGAKKLYDSSTGKKDEKTKPKATEPKVGGNKVTAPKKDTKGKKELKYVVGEPKKDLLPKIKSDKPNWKSGSIAKNLNTAVTAIDKSKKTKPSDNFGSVKKTDTKKADNKTEEKKSTSTSTSASTAKPAVKKADPVGTLATKPTQTIPTTASSNLQPVKSTTPTSSTSSSTSSTSSNASTSPTISGIVPKASIGNKIRGMLNAGRERRAGNAASRGNEARSERLLEKVADSEKKMMMKKGGVVKTKSKSKKK